MICLWFLRKAFSFQQIPKGLMTLEEKLVILLNLTVQCLDPMFTRSLSEFNLKIFLEVYLILFADKGMQVLVEEYNDPLIQKYRSFYPDVWE